MISLIGVVTPGFVLAIILQLVAAHYLGFLPVTGRLDGGIDFEANFTGLLLIDGTLAGRFDVVLDAIRHHFTLAYPRPDRTSYANNSNSNDRSV